MPTVDGNLLMGQRFRDASGCASPGASNPVRRSANLDEAASEGQQAARSSLLREKLLSVDHLVSSFLSQGPARETNVSSRFERFLMETSKPGPLRDALDLCILNDCPLQGTPSRTTVKRLTHEFAERERKIQLAYYAYRTCFPTQLWDCCKAGCFANIATDPSTTMLFNELLFLHEYAEECHAELEGISERLGRRRKGVGCSKIAFTAPTRKERETASMEGHGTDRQKALREFAAFVVEVLPFLYGQKISPTGTVKMENKLCTQAICCLLGISRNFLYNRATNSNVKATDEDQLSCLIDDAGVRLTRHRVLGERTKYPPIKLMSKFECGCDEPCFAEIPQWILMREYSEFAKISRELRPRHKENRYLLNALFCPLSNNTLQICNKALSALYCVSEALISDVRRSLVKMCSDPSHYDKSLLTDGRQRYKYSSKHPMNRYPDFIRDRVERHLDFVLRADPSGDFGGSVCRVYSPEINTQEKYITPCKKLWI